MIRGEQGLNQGDWTLDCNDNHHPGATEDNKAVVSLGTLEMYLGNTPVTLMKMDVKGMEQEVVEGGLQSWLEWGPPKQIVFECNSALAQKHGHDTTFWMQVAEILSCSLLYTLELGLPSWTHLVPFASRLLLSHCGGANFLMVCTEGRD